MANHTKGPRPWLKGNRSRTGMPKPAGSGTPKVSTGRVVNFTFRIGEDSLGKVKDLANREGLSPAYLLREAIESLLEEYNVA